MENQIKFPEIVPLTYKGEKVFTTNQLARLYGCRGKSITDFLRNHKKFFQQNKDYFFLLGNELRKFKAVVSENFTRQFPFYAKSIYLWTQSGATKMAKFVDTDAAKIIYSTTLTLGYFSPNVIPNSKPEKPTRFSLFTIAEKPAEESIDSQRKLETLMELIRLTTDEDLRNKLIRETAKLIFGKDF